MSSRSMSYLSTSILALVAAFSLGTFAQAQEETSEDVTFLDTIIISGTGLPTEILDSPASVSALNEEDIKRVAPSSVARILDTLPGVRVTQSGIERITIRGEGSQRVAIQIDGQTITDHTGYGTPILISPSSIERIEVVRGSASVVSGNNAIGGVVNIITKRGADVPVETVISGGYLGATSGYRGALNLSGSVDEFDYRFTYSESDQGDLKTPDGTLQNSDVLDRELSLHLGYSFGNHYIGLRALDFDLSANVGTDDPNFIIKLPKRDLRKFGAFYEGTDLTPWMSLLRFDTYSQTIDREFENDITIPMGPGMTMNVLSTSQDVQDTWGLNAKAEMEFVPGHRTIVGFSYDDDSQVADKYSRTATPFGPPSVTTRLSDAYIRTFSVYGQHEMELTDKLIATLGGRYYKVDSKLSRYTVNGVGQTPSQNDDSRFVGSAGLVFKPTEDSTLRANISEGYNYPTLGQLYLETTAGGSGLTIGNPNLKPESSTTYEIGGRIDQGPVVLDGTLFYTDAKDYIQSQLLTPGVYQYQNINKAKTWGVELEAEFDTALWDLRPYVGAAYLQREFTYANGYSTKDSGTPDLSGTLGMRRYWNAGSMDGEWDLYLSGESGAISRNSSGTAVDEAAGYTTLNLRVDAQLTDNLVLNFEANNLLNKSYRPLDQYAGAKRSFNFFLTATF